jgi:hypothetical protein
LLNVASKVPDRSTSWFPRSTSKPVHTSSAFFTRQVALLGPLRRRNAMECPLRSFERAPTQIDRTGADVAAVLESCVSMSSHPTRQSRTSPCPSPHSTLTPPFPRPPAPPGSLPLSVRSFNLRAQPLCSAAFRGERVSSEGRRCMLAVIGQRGGGLSFELGNDLIEPLT